MASAEGMHEAQGIMAVSAATKSVRDDEKLMVRRGSVALCPIQVEVVAIWGVQTFSVVFHLTLLHEEAGIDGLEMRSSAESWWLVG